MHAQTAVTAASLMPVPCRPCRAWQCAHLEGVGVFELVIQDGAQPQVASCIQGLTTHAGPLRHKGDKQTSQSLLLGRGAVQTCSSAVLGPVTHHTPDT